MVRHGYLREYDEGFERGDRQRRWDERERGLMFGEHEGGEDRSISRYNQDAHYLRWRDEHMRELDRDYEEYRRERELQFHRDFDSWRRKRHGTPQPLQVGMIQSGLSADPSGVLLLETEAGSPAEAEQDSMATETLGTTSGNRRRR